MRDYAELAALSHVSRARITQIMDLLLLAPDIQEEILHLPRTVVGRDPIRETHLRPIVRVPEWKKQRRMWGEALKHDATPRTRPSRGGGPRRQEPPSRSRQLS